jgi:hypothetical protein
MAELDETHVVPQDCEEDLIDTFSTAIKKLVKKQPCESRNTQDGHPVELPIGV